MPESYFFCAKSRCIPCRTASPLVIPCFSQYSCNLLSVSASRRILYRISLGFSAFGLPNLGDILSPPFCHTCIVLYVWRKCQGKFFFCGPSPALAAMIWPWSWSGQSDRPVAPWWPWRACGGPWRGLCGCVSVGPCPAPVAAAGGCGGLGPVVVCNQW